MPFDNGTLMGKTGTDLTRLLDFNDLEHMQFFLDTYSFYLLGLVFAGKSIYTGHDQVTLCFRGNRVDRKLKLDEVAGRLEAYLKRDRADDVPESDQPETSYPEDDLEPGETEDDRETEEENEEEKTRRSPGRSDRADIVAELYVAARKAVDNFIWKINQPGEREAFIAKHRAAPSSYTIRKTLQIRFWEELSRNCFGKSIFFSRKGNARVLFIPRTGRSNTPEEPPETETPPRPVHDPEAVVRERMAKDAWDIRRYRIFLVKKVGDVGRAGGRGISPMEAYAVYHNLCDREPLLDWFGESVDNAEQKLRYRQTRQWSDQMIADLFQRRPKLTDAEKRYLSRRNISNYRKAYAKKLIEWLLTNVPGLPAYTAESLVDTDEVRIEELSGPLWVTHVSEQDKARPLNRNVSREIMSRAMDRLEEEKTLKL